jgi:hypothetical protein
MTEEQLPGKGYQAKKEAGKATMPAATGPRHCLACAAARLALEFCNPVYSLTYQPIGRPSALLGFSVHLEWFMSGSLL